ncbi:hypothetical protein J7T55_009614 [Diaporthe amygdali]|uniref:uncharacterized protein n=1 Tax=Phomopsis amygdali TaxID=1214568 RepID=UPI0022FE4840|nr:uncharacterized protein J7T55_009614 [Diaporthe amygdali]KAJ0109283.1 hypothetical protein J7T55_009614 [Diaporthe amygdali]
MMRIHDNRASTADSSTDDIIAVIRVDDVGFERGNARMIWRINKINEAVTATAPSTAEANGRDMLITLILVLNSYVRNDEFLRSPENKSPACSYYSVSESCAPKFQNRTKIVPLKIVPSAPVVDLLLWDVEIGDDGTEAKKREDVGSRAEFITGFSD